MLFNSLGFILFLAIILALYYSNFLSWKNRKRMLLLASYIFYGLWNPPLVILLWISTLVDWTAGNKLAVEENNGKRKVWLLLSMFTNLGFLAFFKYGNFILENFTAGVNAISTSISTPVPSSISRISSTNTSDGRSGRMRQSISAQASGGTTLILFDALIRVSEQVSRVNACR